MVLERLHLGELKMEMRGQNRKTSSTARRPLRRAQAGSTLIELMMACLILLVGFTGGLALILISIKNDSRDKTDSTATILSQMVTEMVASVPANSRTNFATAMRRSNSTTP